MPHRTRAELEKLMDQNSTVRLPDGRLITNKANLPTDAELAAAHRDHLIRTRDAADEAGQKRDVAAIQKEIDEADAKAGAATKAATKAAAKAAAKEAAPSTSPADDGKSETPDAATALAKAHTAAELKALCDQHGCPHGTKDEMAAALAAKGVKPTPE
jgi:hypothetical protein